MNNTDIQRLLDNPDSLGTVRLPAGEFEGPFTVSRPCHIVGNGTTLWRRSDTLLEIRARGVTLENIQLEITGSAGGTAVSSKSPDTDVKNVYINGNVIGIDGEEGLFILPKMISAGKIEPEKPFEIFTDIYLPAPAKAKCEISGAIVSPEDLPAGRSVMKISLDPVLSGSVIYGSIEITSKFTRRIYLSLSSDINFTARSGEKVFVIKDEDIINDSAQSDDQLKTPNILPSRTDNTFSPESSAEKNKDSGRLVRGQRISIDDTLGDSFSAELLFRSSDSSIEIDCYTFLLDKNGNAGDDRHLVFFGNTESLNAVKYEDNTLHKIVSVNLKNIPPEIENIAVAYSVYGDDMRHNFSKIKDAKVIFKGENGRTLSFPLEGLVIEKTVVAAQIYRKNNKWKLNAVGQGYRGGLRKLCESFGLIIED